MDQLTDSSVLSHAHSAGLGLQIDIESDYSASSTRFFCCGPRSGWSFHTVTSSTRSAQRIHVEAFQHFCIASSRNQSCSRMSFMFMNLVRNSPFSSTFHYWPFAFPVFVSTSSPPEILSSPPEGLFTLLQNLIDQLLNPSHTLRETSTIILPQGLSPSLTVPLAAILLEYPVAYCPSMAVVSPFLSSVTLDVYEVRLIFLENEGDVTSTRREAWPSVNNEERQHRSVLKFSCPSSLTHSYAGLSYQSMKERLQSCFEHRLVNVWPGGTPIISVHHTIESVDRVTL
ncbi:hypothetical protein J3R30DRAFT_2120786 [Lentinula aciculospora]|uniref:Uncharacterized protein n=1 Tax=Lentinula aciculospora TaxID=153920 RepID=A0A9W9AHQ8_9AGAR|nr:hypothetical protein J3R30DRAFT_2120786 [Lentinula aciculospora]